MVKYLFTLCVLLLNGYSQISAHTTEFRATNSGVTSSSDADRSTLYQTGESRTDFFDIEATDVQEEENEIASHTLVFANSKFLSAIICAVLFLLLYNRLKKGIPFYSSTAHTAILRLFVLFAVFRI